MICSFYGCTKPVRGTPRCKEHRGRPNLRPVPDEARQAAARRSRTKRVQAYRERLRAEALFVADQIIRKEEAECCMARVDALGRPPIGFCSPECVRRPVVASGG